MCGSPGTALPGLEQQGEGGGVTQEMLERGAADVDTGNQSRVPGADGCPAGYSSKSLLEKGVGQGLYGHAGQKHQEPGNVGLGGDDKNLLLLLTVS